MSTIISLVAALAANPMPVQQQEPAQLEPMVVVSTRSPRPVDAVAGMVTVVDAGRMDLEQVRSIGDLVRYEVGISPETAGIRFGLDGFNIRGIGGNRVAIEVDGVPLGDHFDIGSYASAGRALIDPEFLQRVELLRGPASTLYGSDALGGIAAFHSWSPADLTHRRAGDDYYRLRAGYQGADEGGFASILAAHSGDRASLLGGLVQREGNQADHAVPSKSDDEVRYRQRSALGKLAVQHGPLAGLTITATTTRSDRDSDLRSFLGTGRFRSTTLLRGDDLQERGHLALEYRLNGMGAWADFGAIRGYYQDSRTDQFTTEERASRDARYARRFVFDQETSGLEIELFRELGSRHRLGYGFDFQHTDSSELRNATATDLAGNNPTNIILGERFPVRDFPNSRTRETAFWIQDEIAYGRLTLIPALRYERYELDPSVDPVFLADHPQQPVVSVDADQMTPKLGLLYDLSDELGLFAQYARGFRAPPFEDANIGLDIPLFNIRAIPNPDLTPETSDGLEIGLRYRDRRQRLELAAFYNAYDDFIESKVNLGPDPVTGTLIFQSRNIAEAEIYGMELRYERALDDWLQGLSLRASAFWSDGKDRRTDEPLLGLDPPEAILGISWSSSERIWRLDAMARGAQRKRQVAHPEDQFVPAGHAVLDLLAQWRPRPGVVIGAGLFNALDRAYWSWQGVRGLGPADPTLPLLSRPGRNLSLTLELNW